MSNNDLTGGIYLVNQEALEFLDLSQNNLNESASILLMNSLKSVNLSMNQLDARRIVLEFLPMLQTCDLSWNVPLYDSPDDFYYLILSGLPALVNLSAAHMQLGNCDLSTDNPNLTFVYAFFAVLFFGYSVVFVLWYDEACVG